MNDMLITTDIAEARKLLPPSTRDLPDEKVLAIVNLIEKIWYVIIDEEFTSRGL